MNRYSRVAIFGGIYSNHVALRAALDDAGRRGCERVFCLGDLGAFGPNPDKVFPLLIDAGVETIQGNYDNSIANDLSDCQCGYTDPADNHYARLSYQYTYAKTSPRWRRWMADLPREIRLEIADCRLPNDDHGSNRRSEVGNRKSLKILCCHGSPRQMNEFLWESTTPTHLLEKFCDDFSTDVIVATHTGLPWTRELSHGRLFVNCGVLGRPANEGRPSVGYTILDGADPRLAQHVVVSYDHEALAAEMKQEALPEPFIETIRTGWWTTCLEILPAKERASGKF